jgi:DNA-binding XRE family transcriptional regulator
MIYLISHEYQFVKIGYTKNINKRLSRLQVSSPVKLEVLHLIDGDITLEKKLHVLFKDLRTSGEWFKFDASILEYFADKECLLWQHGFTSEEKIPVIGIIKHERLNVNMSLDTLSDMYGCTPQSMYEIEKREMQGSLTLGILYKIAKLFNKKFEYRFTNL